MSWGYGVIQWIQHISYHFQEKRSNRPPKFRILNELPPNLTTRNQQLIKAALLHDLVDNIYHPSKLGPSDKIANPYIQWLCEQHHIVWINNLLPPRAYLEVLSTGALMIDLNTNTGSKCSQNGS